MGITSTGKVIEEADQTLPVVLDTTAILRRAGFRVVVSRTGPTTVLRLGPGDVSGHLLTVTGAHDDVAARDVCANRADADVLVGVYFNSGGADNAGCVTAYDPARSFAAGNLRLADLVQSDVLAAMNAQGWQIPDGGVQPDQGLGSSLTPADLSYGHLLLLGPAEHGYFSTPGMMPGALVEPLFITDPFEGSIAASSRGQQIIAAGLARAVEQYSSRSPRHDQSAASEPASRAGPASGGGAVPARDRARSQERADDRRAWATVALAGLCVTAACRSSSAAMPAAARPADYPASTPATSSARSGSVATAGPSRPAATPTARAHVAPDPCPTALRVPRRCRAPRVGCPSEGWYRAPRAL